MQKAVGVSRCQNGVLVNMGGWSVSKACLGKFAYQLYLVGDSAGTMQGAANQIVYLCVLGA